MVVPTGRWLICRVTFCAVFMKTSIHGKATPFDVSLTLFLIEILIAIIRTEPDILVSFIQCACRQAKTAASSEMLLARFLV